MPRGLAHYPQPRGRGPATDATPPCSGSSHERDAWPGMIPSRDGSVSAGGPPLHAARIFQGGNVRCGEDESEGGDTAMACCTVNFHSPGLSKACSMNVIFPESRTGEP